MNYTIDPRVYKHSHLTYQHAVALRNEYLEDGYVDIEIESYEEDTK
jgi:hypothetical protein